MFERALRADATVAVVGDVRDRVVSTLVACPNLNRSHAPTKVDHDPRGSLGNQKPYVVKMTCAAITMPGSAPHAGRLNESQ
jgi:hypothetical protein